MQTRAQQYSKQAYELISQLRLEDSEKKRYGSICHRFPIMVLRSGLAQAVAFLRIKAETKTKDEGNNESKADKLVDNAYKKFLCHLSLIIYGKIIQADEFQQKIHTMELNEYQRATRSVLNAGIWYKRFAESLLNVKAGDTDDHD